LDFAKGKEKFSSFMLRDQAIVGSQHGRLPMPTLDRSQVTSASYWLDLARRMRADAEAATDSEKRRSLLGFAEGYAKVAERIERSGQSAA
jgi:hypothetical protein